MKWWHVWAIVVPPYAVGVGVGTGLVHDFVGAALVVLLVMLATPRGEVHRVR